MVHSRSLVTFQAVYRIFDLCDSKIVIDNFVLELIRTIVCVINYRAMSV